MKLPQESRIYGIKDLWRCPKGGDTDIRIHGTSDLQTFMENKKKTYTKKGNYNKKESRKDESTEHTSWDLRKYELTESSCIAADKWSYESKDLRIINYGRIQKFTI